MKDEASKVGEGLQVRNGDTVGEGWQVRNWVTVGKGWQVKNWVTVGEGGWMRDGTRLVTGERWDTVVEGGGSGIGNSW